MKRTVGTLVAGLGLALLTIVLFANRSIATGSDAQFDTVAAEVDSAKAAFDAQSLGKSGSFFDKRLDAAKKGVLAAKTQADKNSKRGVGVALRTTSSILRGIKSRLNSHTAHKQISDSVRTALNAVIDKLVNDVKALK